MIAIFIRKIHRFDEAYPGNTDWREDRIVNIVIVVNLFHHLNHVISRWRCELPL